MIQKITNFPGIPPKYQPFVEPAKVCGETLGELIANGWDRLIDALFPPKSEEMI